MKKILICCEKLIFSSDISKLPSFRWNKACHQAQFHWVYYNLHRLVAASIFLFTIKGTILLFVITDVESKLK